MTTEAQLIEVTPLRPPQLTFEGLLSLLASADDSLVMDLDPAVIAGELRGKVDQIKFVIDHLELLAKYLDDRVKPLQLKKRSAELNITRLKTYIAAQMELHNFEKVPGEEWRIQLQSNPPALEILEPATDAHLDLFPEYVEEVRELRWRTGKLRDDLITGTLPADSCTFARIKQGSHARFYPHTPEKLKKGKGA